MKTLLKTAALLTVLVVALWAAFDTGTAGEAEGRAIRSHNDQLADVATMIDES